MPGQGYDKKDKKPPQTPVKKIRVKREENSTAKAVNVTKVFVPSGEPQKVVQREDPKFVTGPPPVVEQQPEPVVQQRPQPVVQQRPEPVVRQRPQPQPLPEPTPGPEQHIALPEPQLEAEPDLNPTPKRVRPMLKPVPAFLPLEDLNLYDYNEMKDVPKEPVSTPLAYLTPCDEFDELYSEQVEEPEKQ